MKSLILLLSVFMVACAPAKKSDLPSSTETPVQQGPNCAVYDACTYSGGGFSSAPTYTCVEKTIQASDHPEIPASYFKNESCITYREDYQTQLSWCVDHPCSIQVRGPGPDAIPAIEL